MRGAAPANRRASFRLTAGRTTAVALAAAALVAAALAWAGWSATRSASVPPLVHSENQNILLITIDTLRGDALGSYGGRARTPHLDRLAAEGTRFTFAHAHAVVTLPSHVSIHTGRYPFEHGVRDNAGFRFDGRVPTLAELARARGFATGAFVGAFPLDRQFGLARGFDTYEDLGGREVNTDDFVFSERPAADVVQRARAWIAQQSGPWFAWVHVFDPHAPYAPPPPYASEYANDLYAGEVAYTDSALGPLLDQARAAPRLTTVVVTADHGEGLGDHGELTHGIFAYESTLRVPLLLAQIGPGSRPSGAVVDRAVRHVDILPTIAELAGLNRPAAVSGRSLTALDADTTARPSYFEAMTGMLKRGTAPLSGIIQDRDKYIELPIQELYDLEADPREQHNRAAATPDRVRVLIAALSQFGAALPGAQVAENAEARARLQSLGYLSGSTPQRATYTDADDPKRLIDVDRLMMQGIQLHQAGRTAEAIEAYRGVIARRPEMGLAYRRLAYLQWESGATSAAIATLRDALARNGGDQDVEIRLGTYLAETGTLGEAIAVLERVTAAAPTSIDALNALGIAYARAGRHGEALRAFDAILAQDARNAFALENVGAVHLQRGEIDAARAAFSRALENDPRSSRAEAGLGVAALKAGRRDDAIAHWKKAVEFDARNFDALFNVATELAAAGRLREAQPYLRAFVATAPPAFYGPDIARLRQLVTQ